jgi:hypothetical protein
MEKADVDIPVWDYLFLSLPYGADSLKADSATLSFSFLLLDKAEIYLFLHSKSSRL